MHADPHYLRHPNGSLCGCVELDGSISYCLAHKPIWRADIEALIEQARRDSRGQGVDRD